MTDPHVTWLGMILAAYTEDYTKAACDVCEQCEPMVMCAFHNLLSLLHGGTFLSVTHADVRHRECAQVAAQAAQIAQLQIDKDQLLAELSVMRLDFDDIREENEVAVRDRNRAMAEARQLQQSLDELHGATFSDRVYHALRDRAEKAEAQLRENTPENAVRPPSSNDPT